jgi:uncharacterized OsmC-like protein
MSTKTVSILGTARKGEQFVVKTEEFDIRISKNKIFQELNAPSPIEYILAGYAGCINAVGVIVAKELNIELESLQVEISGDINTDKYIGIETNERAGFNKINVVVKPNSDASSKELQNWLDILESRCPVYDNLINPTPIHVSLINKYETVASV